jgi:ribose transport system ATP-binding protein
MTSPETPAAAPVAGAARPGGTPRLEVRGLSKAFAGVTVLDDAHLVLMPGEIHALVGQNGSGKSTLIKLISGVYAAERGGRILVDGRHLGPPVHAGRLHHDGLAFVHQDLGLVGDLSVRENVRVGRHATKGLAFIDKAADREACRCTFEFLGVAIDLEARVADLLPSEKVAVAVARALQERAEGSGVIVFDESSRAIPHEALPGFYDMVRLLASQGTSVLFVSHDLKEVLALSDRVTALRNGVVVEMGVDTSLLDEAALTRLVLGRDGAVGDLVAQLPARLGDERIELRGIAGGRVLDLTTTVRAGEVVGVTGSVNSGLLDVAGLLGGATPGQGQILVGGTTLDLSRAKVIDWMRAGVALIPQDRHATGLATGLTVEENVTTPHVRLRGRPWWIGRAWRREETDFVVETFDVRPPRRDAVVGTMSGGNQQKVLLGKWMLGEPRLLTMDEPTQAVDVGARATLLEATRKAAQQGTAIVLCSSEVEDLAAVCDRVLVLQDGVVAHELTAPLTPESILDATFTPMGGAA